jgi:uncharacterized repeat protein (TIGR01451 family)
VRTGRRLVLRLWAFCALLFGLAGSGPLAAQEVAALSVTVTDGVDVTEPGRQLSLRVVAHNAGPADAASAQLVGHLDAPAGVTVFWLCSGAAPDPGVPVKPSPDVGRGDIMTTVTLPAGGSVTCNVSVDVPRTVVGDLKYTAQLKAPATVTDPEPADNQAVDTTRVQATADLQVAVRGLPSAPVSGQVLTFVVSTRNLGPSPATAVTVDIDQPPGAFIDQPPTGPGWRCSDRGTTFRCQLDELPIFSVSELYLAILPAPTAARVALGASAGSAADDPSPSDNTAVAELAISWQDGKARMPTLAGGGFGCSLAPAALAELAAPAENGRARGTFATYLFTLGAVAGGALLRRRRHQHSQRGLL